jgi:hypothetical protein
MKYESIAWEGALIGPETLEKLSDENAIKGQKAGDFGLDHKVRDEIAEAWTEAKALWGLFCARQEREDAKDAYGTSRTRNFWVVPFLELLGYQLENSGAREVAGKSFAISHRAAGYACPVHIVGFNESLDHRRDGSRASPHSLVQEYINLSDGLFALATNGLTLRLLRDSSRLVKLSYLEFNLERIFEEELFSDFAVLFRLLHVSRWPRCDAHGEIIGEASDCLLEFYHQDSLENGSRIREKLSGAVVDAIIIWANSLLNHSDNEAFRASFRNGGSSPRAFYDSLLTLVYRVLFLLVIEERDLSHPMEASADLKALYHDYYSLASLRTRCRGVWKEESRFGDLWETLVDTFSLYEDADRAQKLGLKPLAGDLFSKESFDSLRGLSMDNVSFASGMNKLDTYNDEKRGVSVRVNYAALNVEEFGSIYEGLLEFDAEVMDASGRLRFDFMKGEDRGKSGSHYTPEELVQPLIEHALEPLISDCLIKPDAEVQLLALKICDDACGSGHILLNAGRRVALELSRLRTKADNPDPASYRRALREVIEHCIYGVDSNPQAVRLCKVALWLESHSPGEALGFLDHHIKCGDSLVGATSPTDLLEGIAEEAFAYREGDDKYYASQLRAKHKEERATEAVMQILTDWREQIDGSLKRIIEDIGTVSAMPDTTPEESARKKQTYLHVTLSETWLRLKALADIQLAPFFMAKKNGAEIATEKLYRDFLNGREDLEGHSVAKAARNVAEGRHFFHWFLEFAEVMQAGGFDCFLGNPPFLGNRKLKGTFGASYLDFLTTAYAPAGAIDLVGYFVRRNYSLLKYKRALGTLATNTIAQGGTREGGLEVIEKAGGCIVMAVRSRPWPGAAAVEVSLAAIYKGAWEGRRVLDGREVPYISTYFDDQLSIGNPYSLAANDDKSYMGSVVLGQGFVLQPEEAQALIVRNPKNKEVLFPYLNGEDLNSRPDQSPSRWVINFRDWPLDRKSACEGYKGPVASDYPECLEIVERLVRPQRLSVNRDKYRRMWWQFAEPCMTLYRTIAHFERVIVVAQVSKTLAFTFSATDEVFAMMCIVFPLKHSYCLSILQSSFHASWSWKYCSTMKSDLRYIPSQIFITFPFPPDFEPNRPEDAPRTPEEEALRNRLDSLGKKLDTSRRKIMLRLNIGLTKLYNLYHTKDLSLSRIVAETKCTEAEAQWAQSQILELRETHRLIDEAVRDAYGWKDLPLQHGFHELEFLPENERVRYTISNDARKIVLQELLKLNHQRHADEEAAGLVDKEGKAIKKKKPSPKKLKSGERTVGSDAGQGEMF